MCVCVCVSVCRHISSGVVVVMQDTNYEFRVVLIDQSLCGCQRKHTEMLCWVRLA